MDVIIMKKIILLMIIVMSIPFFVKAETCDSDKITISSIKIENKSESVNEINPVNINGKNIYLDLSMIEPGDNIQYKMVVQNNSNDDYELDENSNNNSSNYIVYKITSEDKSTIVKAKSSKIVFLTLDYKNEVPQESFESGVFKDNQTMVVNLSTKKIDNSIIKNPVTGFKIYIIAFIILLSVLLYFIMKNKSYDKLMILIMGLFIMIPIGASAICKTNIKINLSVEINNNTFTGTIYRYNNLKIKNGTNISKAYILKNRSYYTFVLFNTLDECNAHRSGGAVCEKLNNSLLNRDDFSQDFESFDRKNSYLRHEVKNDIIINTYACLGGSGREYCFKSGDDYSSNAQVVLDFMSTHSYCTGGSVNSTQTSCSGSYGMCMYTDSTGKSYLYYINDYGCGFDSDGYSSCKSYEQDY